MNLTPAEQELSREFYNVLWHANGEPGAVLLDRLLAKARECYTKDFFDTELKANLKGALEQAIKERDQARKEIDHLNKALALKLDALPSGLSAGQSMALEKRLADSEKSDAFHVEACAAHQSHIDELRSELEKLITDNVRLGEINQSLVVERTEMVCELEKAKADRNAEGMRVRNELLPKLEKLEADRYKAMTACEGMRSLAELIDPDEVRRLLDLNDCGKDFNNKLAELQSLLQETTKFHLRYEENREWLERRDKALKC